MSELTKSEEQGCGYVILGIIAIVLLGAVLQALAIAIGVVIVIALLAALLDFVILPYFVKQKYRKLGINFNETEIMPFGYDLFCDTKSKVLLLYSIIKGSVLLHKADIQKIEVHYFDKLKSEDLVEAFAIAAALAGGLLPTGASIGAAGGALAGVAGNVHRKEIGSIKIYITTDSNVYEVSFVNGSTASDGEYQKAVLWFKRLEKVFS